MLFLVLVAMINIVLVLTFLKSLSWVSEMYNTVYFYIEAKLNAVFIKNSTAMVTQEGTWNTVPKTAKRPHTSP